jgi:nucleolar protein 14
VAQRSSQIDTLARLLRFSLAARQPLLLQAHKPIPIAIYIPTFESRSSSSYLRSKDPDAERAAAQKLRAQYRQEKKGELRELRKDNRFLTAVVQEKKEGQDRAYNERMKKVMGGLEGERVEQRREKAKAKEKKRAGKK